jgi:hypothetical protein
MGDGLLRRRNDCSVGICTPNVRRSPGEMRGIAASFAKSETCEMKQARLRTLRSLNYMLSFLRLFLRRLVQRPFPILNHYLKGALASPLFRDGTLDAHLRRWARRPAMTRETLIFASRGKRVTYMDLVPGRVTR